MPKLFLHIGMHKTGSSSIQRVLSDNTFKLLSHGVHYPKAARPPVDPYAHHFLAHSVCQQTGNDWHESWNEVTREIQSTGSPNVVLSTEAFTLASEPQIVAIRDQLTEFHDITVVLYIRNAFPLMLSRYKQQIKSNKTAQTPEEFFSDRYAYCDYATLVRGWGDAFGHERVKFRLYDKLRQSPGIVEDFLGFLPVDSKDLQLTGGSTNVSPSDRETLTLRMLNRLSLPLPGIHRVRRQILRRTRFGKVVVGILAPFTSDALVDPETVQRLRDELRPLTQAFCDQFVEPQDHHYLSVDP